jgi:hypothetical protein
MYVTVASHRRTSISIASTVCALLSTFGCGGQSAEFAPAKKAPDDGDGMTGRAGSGGGDERSRRPCDDVEVDGDLVIEREAGFTARYRAGEPYTKTVMLFGGESVEAENALSNAYIFGLDKVDALRLAEEYPDFYLCSSPGGKAASEFILSYDLVPANCEIFQQIVDALRVYNQNVLSNGDRTSLRFDGAPLTLESVIDEASGADVTEQVKNKSFHLVTAVEQLTGQSVISFGMDP